MLLPLLMLASCTLDPRPVVQDVRDAGEAVAQEVGLALDDASVASRALSTPPVRQGNTARLLTNGEASFAERLAMIDRATESIWIQALIWKGDTVGREITERLIAKKKAQPEIDIRVIVDAYSNIQDTQAQLLFFELQNHGIGVEGFEAFYLHWLNEIDIAEFVASNKRYHEKYWVIDGDEAVVGGMNIADEYARCTADPVLLWRDQDLFVAGPVASDVAAAFLDNHERLLGIKASKPDLFDTRTYWRRWRQLHPTLEPLLGAGLDLQRAAEAKLMKRERLAFGDCPGTPVLAQTHEAVPIQFVRNRPREDEGHIHARYLQELGQAKERAWIANAYFVPTADLRAALIAAAQRGVDVKVVTNSDQTNDIGLITVAGRAHYQPLIAGGVEVYEWVAHEQGEGTLHAKYAVFDDTSVIGSHNLDPRSIGLNSEDIVAVTYAPLTDGLAAHFAGPDLSKARRISAEQATAWAHPDAPPKLLTLDLREPGFDAKALEMALVRALEPHL